MTNTRNRSVTGKLIFWSFVAVVLVVIGYAVLNRDRGPGLVDAPGAAAPTFAEQDNDLLDAQSPHYPGEGAAGLLEDQENAGAAVNPVTPTGRAGGPAGQTPAYGQPGGAPSRVVSQ
ncbi:MAG: hypothetical protein M3M95_06165 [Pseudomonadota bacterium]|nr:hypothetical protein [Pseudomonadota bacterium]